MKSKKIRNIGFVIDGLVPTLQNCLSKTSLSPLFRGWPSTSSIQTARFSPFHHHEYLRECCLRYELYRPLRRYDAVIFLKSMNADSLTVAKDCRKKGAATVFDLNVDYLRKSEGIFYYDGMAPSDEQFHQAKAMTDNCDAVIADSNWLKSVAQRMHANVVCIPDCIQDEFIQNKATWYPSATGKIPLLWSGEAVKMFELLAIEDVIKSLKNFIVLKIITNSLDAIRKIYQPWRERLNRLLEEIDIEILDFRDIPNLLRIYDAGGIFISPRFLDNSYNMGHTEWKITLPMARYRQVVCSPQPSYLDVARLAGGETVRVCATMEEWMVSLEKIIRRDVDWENEQLAAGRVVQENYSSSVLVRRHAAFMNKIIEETAA